MTLNYRRKAKLIDKLKDKEYRDAFVSEHIDTGVSFQIRALRKQRNWTQKQLEENSSLKQEQISLLEDPNNDSLTLKTLKRLASSFDIGLMVRFVPYSDLAEWELNLTSSSLDVVSFKDDKYFQEVLSGTETNKYYVGSVAIGSPDRFVAIARDKNIRIMIDKSKVALGAISHE